MDGLLCAVSGRGSEEHKTGASCRVRGHFLYRIFTTSGGSGAYYELDRHTAWDFRIRKGWATGMFLGRKIFFPGGQTRGKECSAPSGCLVCLDLSFLLLLFFFFPSISVSSPFYFDSSFPSGSFLFFDPGSLEA